jgi:hypothetical protein
VTVALDRRPLLGTVLNQEPGGGQARDLCFTVSPSGERDVLITVWPRGELLCTVPTFFLDTLWETALYLSKTYITCIKTFSTL